MNGATAWLLSQAETLLAFGLFLTILVALWCFPVSPVAYAARLALDLVVRFFRYRRTLRFSRASFRWPGRAYGAVRAWLDGRLGHASIKIVMEERLDRLKQAVVAARQTMKDASLAVIGLGGASGSLTLSGELAALSHRTEEVVAKLKSFADDDEDLVEAYKGRARSNANIVFGVFFGAAFALGNGVLLAQMLVGVVPYYFMHMPVAYPVAVLVVIFEMGLGWLVAFSAFGEDAARHRPLRAIILVAIAIAAFVEGVFYGLFSSNFDIALPLFNDQPWTKAWLAPFGTAFVIATSATGYVFHRSWEQRMEHRAAGRLAREVKTVNRYVKDLPALWSGVADKARAAEGTVDSYVGALGGKEAGLRGAIDQIAVGRDELVKAFDESRIDDWTRLAEGAEGDVRSGFGLDMALLVLTLAAAPVYVFALHWLLAQPWPEVPAVAWWPIAVVSTGILYSAGFVAFGRLQYGGASGRLAPPPSNALEVGVVGAIGTITAIALLWASVAQFRWIGIFVGLFYLACALGIVRLGYFAERAGRGLVLASVHAVATLVLLGACTLTAVVNLVLWSGCTFFAAIAAVLRFLEWPTQLLIAFWRRRSRPQPARQTA